MIFKVEGKLNLRELIFEFVIEKWKWSYCKEFRGDCIGDDYNDDDDDGGEGIWMKNKAAPHQTDSIDIGGPPSVIHPCNYRPDRDDHDHYDRDDHGFLRLLCFWWSSHINIGEVPG